jgi:hypothetical protein
MMAGKISYYSAAARAGIKTPAIACNETPFTAAESSGSASGALMLPFQLALRSPEISAA